MLENVWWSWLWNLRVHASWHGVAEWGFSAAARDCLIYPWSYANNKSIVVIVRSENLVKAS